MLLVVTEHKTVASKELMNHTENNRLAKVSMSGCLWSLCAITKKPVGLS